MKKLKDRLFVFWISVFAIILIGTIESHAPSKGLSYPMVQQDTIKKDAINEVIPVKNLTDREKKELEYKEWKSRSEQIDKDMERLQIQSAMMDSLLGKPDTTKIIK